MLTAAIGLLVFLLALDQGGYGLGTRGAAGILIWWSLLVLVAAGVWPRAAVPRAALVTGGLLAAFCVLTGVSALWADSAEGAFLELGRVGIYLGVFAVAVAAAARGGMAAWTDGLAGGIAAVAVLALADRCFSWHEPAELRSFLPGAEVRLGYPLGYWNALGILLGIGVPLLLRPAVASGRTLVRGVAAGALPAMGIALFLTSSRGGVIVAAVGALAFVALAGRALLALSALAIGGAATAVAVAVLEARSEFLDGPLESAAAVSQGKSAAPLLLLACVVSGVVYALASRALMGRRLRLRRGVLVAAGAVAVLVVSAAVVVADPGARFEDFKTPPNLQATDRAGFVRDHLLSGEGSGRWQFWSAAVDQFEEHPFAGDGAGSYQAWWLRHGSLAFFVQDAHSLYLETLGELGLLGLALLAGALVAALVAAGRRLRGSPDDLRPAMAAAIAALVAFAVGAAIDWIWEMTVVGVIGAICLGLVTGPAGLAADARPPRARPPRARPRPRRFARVVVCAGRVLRDRRRGASVDGRSSASSQPRGARGRRLGCRGDARLRGARPPTVGGVTAPPARSRTGESRRSRRSPRRHRQSAGARAGQLAALAGIGPCQGERGRRAPGTPGLCAGTAPPSAFSAVRIRRRGPGTASARARRWLAPPIRAILPH